jgi:hypothetical protein
MTELRTKEAFAHIAMRQLELYEQFQVLASKKSQLFDDELQTAIRKTMMTYTAQGRNAFYCALASASALLLAGAPWQHIYPGIQPQTIQNLLQAVQQIGISTFKEVRSANLQGESFLHSSNVEMLRQKMAEIRQKEESYTQAISRLMDTQSAIIQSQSYV